MIKYCSRKPDFIKAGRFPSTSLNKVLFKFIILVIWRGPSLFNFGETIAYADLQTRLGFNYQRMPYVRFSIYVLAQKEL